MFFLGIFHSRDNNLITAALAFPFSGDSVMRTRSAGPSGASTIPSMIEARALGETESDTRMPPETVEKTPSARDGDRSEATLTDENLEQQIAREHQAQDQHDRGDVDTAEHWDEPANGPQNRLGDAV